MRTTSDIRRFLLPAWILAALLPAAFAQEGGGDEAIRVSGSHAEAMDRYGAEPVEAIRVSGPNQFSPMTLIDRTAAGVEMRYGDLESPITVPGEELNFSVNYRPQIDRERYASLRNQGREEEALELLRAEAYPLLKFVPLDPDRVRIHSVVRRLLDELNRLGHADEAAAILDGFPRERITGVFRSQAVETASALVESGEMETAYELLQEFPIGPGETAFAPIYLDLATEFRLREDWERARNLYKDVQLASGPTEYPEAFLWEAYIHQREGRSFMVEGILEQFGELDEESPYFSLRELVRGIVLAEEGSVKEALATLAKGVVYSTTNDPWTPELLFRTANLYEEMKMETAAIEIRDQLRFFYPDSTWTRRLPDSTG
jgi:tetratricopeptide (TPR) repeat protein